MRISAAEWAIAMGVGLLLYGVLALSLLSSFYGPDVNRMEGTPGAPGRTLAASRHLGAALLGDRNVTPDATVTGMPAGRPRERQKMDYLLPFQIVSVHLLVVLIGAAYLARAKRRRGTVS